MRSTHFEEPSHTDEAPARVKTLKAAVETKRAKRKPTTKK